MAHLPPHPLFLLFLAAHVFVASHGSPLPPSSTYDDSVCSELFKCGSVDIRYPFYLSNATGATPDYTSYSCGYTDLKILCQGEGETAIATLQLGQVELHNYTVQNISYDKYTIILRDTEALTSGVMCPTVSHNVTFDPELLNYTDSSLGSLTFFYGCNPLADIEEHQINCKGFSPPPGSGDGVSFVFTSDSEDEKISREYGLAGHCNEMVTVPVHEKALVRNGPLTLQRDYGDVLQQGFELEWKQSKGQQCHQCEESHKGRCAYNEKKEYLACLCSGGICKNPNPPSSAGRDPAWITTNTKCTVFTETIKRT
ncbi:hypothetical protein ACQJBY_023102 [Aegilops geniculata]